MENTKTQQIEDALSNYTASTENIAKIPKREI